MSYLKPGGSLLVNDQAIYPVPVLAGLAEYPQDITGYLKAKVKDTVVLDALGKARECGNARAANVVLVGLLARRLPFAEDNWQDALAARVPARFLEVNRKAFAAGYGI